MEADRKEVKRWLCSTFNRLIFSFGWCFCWKENLRISAVLLIKLIVTFFYKYCSVENTKKHVFNGIIVYDKMFILGVVREISTASSDAKGD